VRPALKWRLKILSTACACGADSVIILDANKEGALSTFSAGYGYSNIKAKAIRYKE
jgi:hypothetical protein